MPSQSGEPTRLAVAGHLDAAASYASPAPRSGPGCAIVRPLRRTDVPPGVLAAGEGIRTLTVLCSDLWRSTQLRLELGEDAADRWFSGFDRATRFVVEAVGGNVVKSLGDGLLAVFTSASAALDAAVAVQVESTRHRAAGEPPRVRVGLASGDVLIERHDVAGLPVVIAARLCRLARPASIVSASVVVQLAGGRGSHRCHWIGWQSLHGFEDRVAAHEVDWTGEEPEPVH